MNKIGEAFKKAGIAVFQKLGPKGLIVVGIGTTGGLGALGVGAYALAKHRKKKKAEAADKANEAAAKK